MTSAQVDRALDRVRLETHPVHDRQCWGWGALAVDRTKERCRDGCGRPAEMLYPDGARCWRCALWHHLADCPNNTKGPEADPPQGASSGAF